MNINQLYITGSNKINKTQPAFASTVPIGIQADTGTQKLETLPAVSPDYNVRVPVAYSKIQDIKLPNDLTAQCYKLATGQNVVIVPKDGPTVVKTYVNTGSFNEPDNLRGISHYIEHNLFNGSEDLGDKVFFDEVNKMGADTNASTSFSNTNYFIKSNLLEEGDLENKIKLHAGMLQSPKFLLDKLEKEKKIVNSEINMCVSENENLGYSQTIKNLFNIQSTSLDLIAGTTDNITNLTRDDVVKYFNDNYYPGNMTTVITGDVNSEETINLIAKYFNTNRVPSGSRHFEKLTQTDKPVRQDIISPKSESNATTVFIGFAGPENNNTKDKIHMQALANLAGGLHNSRVSDIERNYGIYVNFAPDRLSSRPEDKSLMMIESVVSDDKSEKLLKDLYSVIDKLSKVPPTEEELTAIKNKMKKSHNQLYESSYGLNNAIGTAFLNDNIQTLKDFDKIVDEMSAQDIINTAKKYLDLNKAALTVVHPNNSNPEQITNSYKQISNTPVSIAFTGADKRNPITIENISTYRNSNNLEIVLNDASTKTMQYRFSVAEKNWTPKEAAIAEVLNDMLNNAGTLTKSQEEISKQADILGIRNGIYSTGYGISVLADFPVDTTEKTLKLLNDRIKNPNLTQKEFESAIARLKDEFANSEVSPYDKLFKSLYQGTAHEFTPKDILKSLDKITLDDVKNFHNDIFTNGQGIATITGPFSKQPELKQQVFNSLNEIGKLQPYDSSLEKLHKPIEKTEVFTDVHLKNQADIIQAYKFKYSGNIKDEVCLELLNTILGGTPSSRLFSDLRETRHLAYSVSSNFTTPGDTGVFMLKIGTTTENQETGEQTFDNIKKSIDGFNENIKRIITEKVTEEELNNAKKAIKSGLLNSLELNAGKNNHIHMAKTSPYGVAYINKQLENIDSITVDDIYNTARNIFNSKPVYSLTATKASLDANKEFLDSLTK